MARSQLRVYYGPPSESQPTITETTHRKDVVSVPLGEIFPLLADAVRIERIVSCVGGMDIRTEHRKENLAEDVDPSGLQEGGGLIDVVDVHDVQHGRQPTTLLVRTASAEH